MADDTTISILYGGSDVFNGLAGTQPIPYVTRAQQPIRYGDHWGQLSTISINGQITGNATELFTNKDAIVGAFKKDYQAFLVKDGNDKILDITGVVKSINFGDHKHYGLLDYSIEIEAYEQDLFSGQWGILNPADQISYTDNEEGHIDITHTSSAKGFHTGDSNYNQSNALKNAKDFVFSRRNGWASRAKPIFASGEADFSSVTPMLINSNESIDRFEGTYELTDTYRFSKTGLNPVISTQSVSVESGIETEAITVTVNGEILAGKSGTLDIVRSHLKDINMFNVASNSLPDNIELYSIPINLDIKENPQANSLTYSASYDNIAIFGTGEFGENDTAVDRNAYFDYTVSFNTDEISEITTATINGTVKGRGGIIHRRKNVENYYHNVMQSGTNDKLSDFLCKAAGTVYSDFVTGSNGLVNHQLNPTPKSMNVKSGNVDAQIEISAEFNDEDFLEGFSDVSYSINTKASMPIRTISSSARFKENGHYMIGSTEIASREETSITANMTYDREYYSTNVIGVSSEDPNTLYQIGNKDESNELRSLVGYLAAEFTPSTFSKNNGLSPNKDYDVRLAEEIINEDRETRSMSANYKYAYHGSTFEDKRDGSSDKYNAFMRVGRNKVYMTSYYYGNKESY